MTATMPRRAARRHRERPDGWLRRLATTPKIGTAIIVIAVLAFLGLSFFRSVQTVEAEQVADFTGQQLAEVSMPLAELCATDPSVRARVGGAACDTAQQVVVMGTPGPGGADGLPGAVGAAGRGISSTSIDGDGHLIVSYTDGQQLDVGLVVGPAGAQGDEGVGVVSSTITDGRLMLTFSNDTTVDVGRVVGEAGLDGADGRSITSTEIVEGRLIISYDDGTTQDAGPVPAGPAGKDGSPAESITFNSATGTTVCPRSGGPDTAPVYDCQLPQ